MFAFTYKFDGCSFDCNSKALYFRLRSFMTTKLQNDNNSCRFQRKDKILPLNSWQIRNSLTTTHLGEPQWSKNKSISSFSLLSVSSAHIDRHSSVSIEMIFCHSWQIIYRSSERIQQWRMALFVQIVFEHCTNISLWLQQKTHPLSTISLSAHSFWRTQSVAFVWNIFQIK